MTKVDVFNIAIDNIEATAATQVRVKLDKGVIEAYQEELEAGADFPAIVVFREENTERFILADGFHRLYAAVNLDWKEIVCEVHEGKMIDALMYALGANHGHGLRRTNKDKRHAVEMALKDPEISRYSQEEIADICRVTRQTVNRIHNQLVADDEPEDVTKLQDPKVGDAEPDDFRDDGAVVTQEDVELGEIREALKAIKALPYDGADTLGKLDLTADDYADLEYVSTWCASAVLAYRKGADDG